MKALNNYISKSKGMDFRIDERIPFGRIFCILCEKALCLCYGFLRTLRRNRCFIHPSSTIRGLNCFKFGRNLSIGRHCFVDALSEKGLTFGDNVSMGPYTFLQLTGSYRFLGKGMKVGNNVGLESHGFYGSGKGFLEIGDDTIFGNYVSIHPESHNYEAQSLPIRLLGVISKGGVKIGRGCWIGAKATILDGTTIGNHCVVAAGAVVKGSFPDNVVIGGVPAKIIKHI